MLLKIFASNFLKFCNLIIPQIKMSVDEFARIVDSNSKLISQKMNSIEKKLANVNLLDNEMLEKKKCQLKEENNQFSKKIESLLVELTNLEKLNGVNVNIKTRDESYTPAVGQNPNSSNQPYANTQPPSQPQLKKNKDDSNLPQHLKETESAPKDKKNQAAKKDGEVTVSRLDFRIGRIINAKKHPDADSLYVEEVDVGEDKPRTIISGLVKHVPLEEMQNRVGLFLCNLKPVKMRGITSEGMLMCASDGEKVEILIPPPNCVPGEKVKFEKYPGEPDGQLNPKKKVWETIAPDLKTDANCVATYKGEPFMVPGKGVIKSASLANYQIK